MSNIVYTSNIKIVRKKGSLRYAYLPAENEPVKFGLHGAIAEHYGVSDKIDDPHATTIDYLISAVGGCLTGTFGGALRVRKIDPDNDKLSSEVIGEVELEDNVLVVKRIHIKYTISSEEENKKTIERVHKIHKDYCAVYKSIYRSIDVTTELHIEFI
ncbi:OsmC family protein [Tenacibaculum ovolyticum]|uniref:OsmC family protein n=1 Tax=Tenacibaculum ovolyticum TaxID=104270 RepID=UPI003BA86A22